MYYCALYNIKINSKRVAKVDFVHRLILSGLLSDMKNHIRLKRAKYNVMLRNYQQQSKGCNRNHK